MKNKGRKFIGRKSQIMKATLLFIAIAAPGFLFHTDLARAFSKDQRTQEPVNGTRGKQKKKDKIKQWNQDNPANDIIILQRWDLPAELKEISGIAYIDDHRFACVQDEDGKIFIFNRTSNQVEKAISFGAAGDYEGIAVDGNMAYVLRADGRLFEVDMEGNSGSGKQHTTGLTIQQNVEGITLDKKNDRLLLAIKDDEPGNPGYKGIYAFNLSNRQFVNEPVIKIDLSNEMFSSSNGKNDKSIMPSEIAIHPVTGEIYIADGPKARLLVMDVSGNMKKLLHLGEEFAQPEGLAFSPAGELFISNEGTKQPGNIFKVAIP